MSTYTANIDDVMDQLPDNPASAPDDSRTPQSSNITLEAWNRLQARLGILETLIAKLGKNGFATAVRGAVSELGTALNGVRETLGDASSGLIQSHTNLWNVTTGEPDDPRSMDTGDTNLIDAVNTLHEKIYGSGNTFPTGMLSIVTAIMALKGKIDGNDASFSADDPSLETYTQNLIQAVNELRGKIGAGLTNGTYKTIGNGSNDLISAINMLIDDVSSINTAITGINGTLGSATLATTAQNLKAAINELKGRDDGQDSTIGSGSLSTTAQDLKAAINELLGKIGTGTITGITEDSNTIEAINALIVRTGNASTSGKGIMQVGSGLTASDGTVAVDTNLIATKADISSVYRPQGSFSSISDLDPGGYEAGDVFNITTEFSVAQNNADFLSESRGKTFPAGTNIVVVEVGNPAVKYFDVLTGFVDFDRFQTKTVTARTVNGVSLTDIMSIIDAINDYADYILTLANTISGRVGTDELSVGTGITNLIAAANALKVSIDGINTKLGSGTISITSQGDPVNIVEAINTLDGRTQEANATTPGIVKIDKYAAGQNPTSRGVWLDSTGFVCVRGAYDVESKAGVSYNLPIVPHYQEYAVFYGLAKAAGVDLSQMTGTASENLGNYTEAAKDAICAMLGIARNAYIVSNATTGNIPKFKSTGEIEDSGFSPSDFLKTADFSPVEVTDTEIDALFN